VSFTAWKPIKCTVEGSAVTVLFHGNAHHQSFELLGTISRMKMAK